MILVALGANLPSQAGSPAMTLASALGAMAAHRIRVRNVSHYYETPAWPDPADPPFVNAVARIDTPLGPAALLEALHAIEAEFGRQRSVVNAPRTLDLDLIDYDGRVEAGPPVLPHPRMAERAFVLVPLRDVAPDWRHPQNRKSLADLIEAIPAGERDAVRRIVS